MKCPLNTVIIVEYRVALRSFRVYTWPQPIRDHSRVWLVCVCNALFSVGHVSFVELLVLLVVIVVAINWIWI